jgi:PAS domain S-box-containing protein
MKLSKRYLSVPIVLAIFTYLFYSAYKSVKDKTLNEFNNQQFALAKQASIGIESFFDYYLRELLFLSKLEYVSDLNDQGRNLLADFYNNHSDQIEAISVVDDMGILKYTFPYNKSAIDQDISYQEHIRTVIKTHKPTGSDVFISVQGYKAIAYHIPIITGNEYKGSIAILIPLNNLGKRFIENIRTGETGYGWMISKDGIVLYNPATGQTGKSVKEIYSTSPSLLELISKTQSEKEGTSICYIAPTPDEKKELSKSFVAFYRVSLGNTFWTILIVTPEKEVFATLTSFRNRLSVLFCLIVIVMVIYYYLSFKASSILKEEKKRRALENILHESEKRFRIMFELSPVGIILIDEEGTIIEVNSSFCENLGYSRKELLSNNIRLFTSPAKEDDIKNNVAEILSGKTLKHEVTNIKKDGTTCVIALSETKIILPDGKPGILSVSNDVSERKSSVEKMLILSRALESIGECVSITDLKNEIIFVNRAFCKTYGYKQEDLIGKDIGIVRYKTVGKLGEKILSDTISGGWTGILINVRKDGSEFPVELSTSCILDENNNPIALIGTAVDITERRRVHLELVSAKEKAEESDRLKSAFLANMSHELRTPLNAIIGFSSLMIDTGKDEDTLANLKIIFDSGQHLLRLVEDILDTSMIEIGQIKINYEKVGINSILSEVKNIITGEKIKENKTEIEIVLNTDPEKSETYIFTDSRKLKQVLINLLKNSLKFTDAGYIEFGFTVIEKAGIRYLRFFAKDTGIGIEKMHQNVIFNIFRQIDDTHTRKYGGAGIGLSIAKKIVELLGGEIWVESDYGQGSVFYFTIPFFSEKRQTENMISDTIKVAENIFSGKTIMIAEDEISNFEFLRIFFKNMNIRVLWAKTGTEAVDLCETDSSINLVFMDIKIPMMNGYEATKRIKNKRPELPVIAQTAYVTSYDKEEALKAGCDDYLSKPIQIKQLKDLLYKYLRSD